jgi:putative tryptophan/tyrosine transport system substrate-binding protein
MRGHGGSRPSRQYSATHTIPILFAFVADPIASDLVKSFARPGGNLTGFTNLPQSSLSGRWLSLLKDLAPGIDRVMVLHDPANAIFASMLEDTAATLHVTIHSALATAIADAEREIETFARDPGGGTIVVPYALTVAERATILALAARHRLPAIYGSDIFVGGLMIYAPVADDIYRGVAQYADSILKGAKPADLPVQAPTKFELVINLKTAKTLGLTIPPKLLAIADEVIE